MKTLAVMLLVACAKPAPTPAPLRNTPQPAGAQAVASTAMSGPFRTFQEACHAIPPCVSTHFIDEDPAPTHPTSNCDQIDVGLLDEWQDTRLHHHETDLELHLLEVSCAVPRSVPRDVTAGKTFAFLRRADGWWIGPALFEHDDERNCGQQLEPGEWERHGRLVALAVQRSHACWACTKGGEDTVAADLVLAFDPTEKPVAYQPVVTGAHAHREVSDPDRCAAVPPYDAVLAPRWSGDSLILTGTTPPATAGGLELPDAVDTPTAGTYRFTR